LGPLKRGKFSAKRAVKEFQVVAAIVINFLVLNPRVKF